MFVVIVITSSFNPTLVRLRLLIGSNLDSSEQCFNPTLVRLRRGRKTKRGGGK